MLVPTEMDWEAERYRVVPFGLPVQVGAGVGFLSRVGGLRSSITGFVVPGLVAMAQLHQLLPFSQASAATTSFHPMLLDIVMLRLSTRLYCSSVL